jgi:hypothetical protein
MARSSRARKAGEDAEKRKWTLIILVTIALLAVVGVSYFSLVRGARPLDKVTLCPASPDSLTVLVVDVTDPMNTPQKQDFLNQLDRLRASIPKHGQLSIFKVDATSDKLLQPVITKCNPGNGEDADDLTGNPVRDKKRWEDEFKAPLDQAFETVLSETEAARSPILESIQSVALTEFQKTGHENKPRRLIVASDLIQNTEAISFYKELPEAEEFLASDAFSRVRTDLRDIKVELWMLQRADFSRTQPRALPDLWDAIISKQGGEVTRIYTVSG